MDSNGSHSDTASASHSNSLPYDSDAVLAAITEAQLATRRERMAQEGGAGLGLNEPTVVAAHLGTPPPQPTQSGRLGLARWSASPIASGRAGTDIKCVDSQRAYKLGT